jgi:glycosyltransferase involved in cell wall biosynthesis
MEAFVLGCPVVASECIGLKEVVRDTPAVVVKQTGDSKGLALALKEVIENGVNLKQDALEFVPKARARFDVRRTAADLDALLWRVTQMERVPS